MYLGMDTLEFRIYRILIQANSDQNPSVLSDF